MSLLARIDSIPFSRATVCANVCRTNMANRALCVGINDYPGSNMDLAGCVNDAKDWQALLEAPRLPRRSSS